MIELSRTKDGKKQEGMEAWGDSCFMGNGVKEGQGDGMVGGEGGGDGGGAGRGREQLQCCSPIMDNISGEFGLVVNGHSLVRLILHTLIENQHTTLQVLI